MALTWDNSSRKDRSGKVVSESYRTRLPHWGEASVHPHIHHPGEMFLNCPALGIDMHPLGQIGAVEALNPAEQVLMRTLKEHAVWCLDAMEAIGSPEDGEIAESR